MKLFVRVLIGLTVLVALALGGFGVALVQSAIKPSRTVGIEIVSAGVIGILMPPMVCADADGFDRAAFHCSFNGEVVSFFSRRLNYSGEAP